MDRRERPASDVETTDQPLSDQELEAVNGGATMIAGLGGPDTRKSSEHAKWIDLISISQPG